MPVAVGTPLGPRTRLPEQSKDAAYSYGCLWRFPRRLAGSRRQHTLRLHEVSRTVGLVVAQAPHSRSILSARLEGVSDSVGPVWMVFPAFFSGVGHPRTVPFGRCCVRQPPGPWPLPWTGGFGCGAASYLRVRPGHRYACAHWGSPCQLVGRMELVHSVTRSSTRGFVHGRPHCGTGATLPLHSVRPAREGF